PEFELRAEQVVGLSAVPAQELVRVGVTHQDLVLGFRVDESDQRGLLSIEPRLTRMGLQSLVTHTVVDSVVTTAAHLKVEVKGAPVRELVLCLPAGKGAVAAFGGPEIKERGVLIGKRVM